MTTSYWTKTLQKRLSRRRALAVSGGAAAAAAFLAACGGGSDAGSAPRDNSGLLYTPVDETSKARHGGTYVDSHPGVILTHDPMKTGINIRGARRGFSQLFRIADGILKNTDGTIMGDLAQSWEISPDKLTLTVKLEPEAGFAPVPPVNGRVVDAEDVLFSWERLKREGIGASELANDKNPQAPILSMTAPDSRTVVIKLKEPNSTIFSLLGQEVLGSLYILAKEGADPSKLDIPRQPVGTGPYYMVEQSEVAYRWKKNPNFKRSTLKNNEPYIEEIYEPVIQEIAAAVAQFRTGALYEYNVPAEEVVSVKRDIMDLMMRATSPQITGTERLYFGHNDDSPFKDERVRIAYMKTIDRDAFIATAHNTDRFEREGLPVETFWEGSIAAGSWGGWYLDPRSKEFGPNSKNYQYDLAEAKRLVEAAGYKTPLDITITYAEPGPSSFPQTFYRRAEIWIGMIENSGVFRVKRNLINYQTEYNTERYRFSKGRFSGATWGPDTSSPDASVAAFFLYNSAGGYFEGGDQKMDDLTNRIRQEFDVERRRELVHEVQRYNGEKFYNNKIGTAGGFALNWPVLRNVNVYRGGTNWLDITTPSGLRAWLDPSQPPLNRG